MMAPVCLFSIFRFVNPDAPLVPQNVAGATVAGGTLAAGTYGYKVASITASGESEPSPEEAVTHVGAGPHTTRLTWDAVAGATGYRVYGRTSGGPWGLLGSPVGATFDDTGSGAPGAAPPEDGPAYAVRFDLLAWGDIGAAFTPGNAPVLRRSLAMDGVDGVVQTATSRGEAILVVPWIIEQQVSWDAIRDAFALCAAELDRATNVLEFRFTDDTASYFADTFRAEIPSLLSAPAPQPPVSFRTLSPILINIPRVATLRGVGAYV